MGIAVEMSLLTSTQGDMYAIPYLLLIMAAILNIQHTQTSVRVLTSLFVLPDPENMGIAVGILFLSHLEAEIYVFPFWRPPYSIYHIRFGRTVFALIPFDCSTSKM